MSTAADYAGRTVDVLAFTGQRAAREARLVPALAVPGHGGEICVGIQKLAQRWLIEFLTVQGSMVFLPERGCEFMAQLQRGELRTTLDAEQAFQLAALTAQTNLIGEEDDSVPDDEAMASAELLSLAISGDQLTLSVKINSRAGSSREVILPISVIAGGS